MERISYMNPVLGMPYGRGLRYQDPYEEQYRSMFTVLERCFQREMETLYRFNSPYSESYFRAEHDARSWFEYEKNLLYERVQYQTQWHIRNQQFEMMKYQMYTPIKTYLLPKETTVPTETKKFIIISSAGAAEHPIEHKTLAEAEAEATRLAKQFPKQEFTVYVTQKSFKVADKPVDVKTYV